MKASKLPHSSKHYKVKGENEQMKTDLSMAMNLHWMEMIALKNTLHGNSQSIQLSRHQLRGEVLQAIIIGSKIIGPLKVDEILEINTDYWKNVY